MPSGVRGVVGDQPLGQGALVHRGLRQRWHATLRMDGSDTRGSALSPRDLDERLAAALVARRAALLLGALLGVVVARPRRARSFSSRSAASSSSGAVASSTRISARLSADLQVALALREAHDRRTRDL